MKFFAMFFAMLLCGGLAGCSAQEPPSGLRLSDSTTPVLVFGDSLSAAYQMDPQDGWVALMEQRMLEEGWIGPEQSVYNASVSGETTHGGLKRLAEALEQANPEVVILELGANDALRRQSMVEMQHNLASMIVMAKQSGAQVFLVGVDLPSKFFFVNTDHFTQSYEQLAQQHDVVLIPNLLDGVNSDSSMMKDDGLHPNEQGQPEILDNVWPHLQEHIL